MYKPFTLPLKSFAKKNPTEQFNKRISEKQLYLAQLDTAAVEDEKTEDNGLKGKLYKIT